LTLLPNYQYCNREYHVLKGDADAQYELGEHYSHKQYKFEERYDPKNEELAIE